MTLSNNNYTLAIHIFTKKKKYDIVKESIGGTKDEKRNIVNSVSNNDNCNDNFSSCSGNIFKQYRNN